jgi:ferredoxin
MTLVPLIDPNACSAHGDCEDIAPEIFHLADIAEVIGTGPDELMIAAAEACPSSAITIVDAATREQVYP